eukprot:932012-Ditylum_brightwellii.AAC.1
MIEKKFKLPGNSLSTHFSRRSGATSLADTGRQMGISKSMQRISRAFACNNSGCSYRDLQQKTAAAAGSLEVSSTNATVEQVQSSTGTYSEGAAVATEAAILQLLPNLLSPLQQEN